MAFGVFFRVLFDAAFAGRVRAVQLPAESRPQPEAAPPAKAEPVKTPLVEHDPGSALQLLSLLQREGRLVDFLQEDVASYSDADIGAAARVVHDSCKKALDDYLTLEPVRTEAEGSAVTLEPGFDATAIRLTGNVVGQPPFKGTLAHRGWRATRIELPKHTEGHDVNVIAPAEVEL